MQNLTYAEGSNVITDYTQVDVIHSTQGGVGQENQWNVLGSSKVNYQLKRLKKKWNEKNNDDFF